VIKPHSPVSRRAEMAALVLALCSLLLGFAAVSADAPDALSSAWTTAELSSTLLLILGGAALAAALAPRLPIITITAKPLVSVGVAIRRVTVALGAAFVWTDGILRQWPVAGVWLVSLAIAFGTSMFAMG
jgi:hypothetical protein